MITDSPGQHKSYMYFLLIDSLSKDETILGLFISEQKCTTYAVGALESIHLLLVNV
jgi:hypothetical protein